MNSHIKRLLIGVATIAAVVGAILVYLYLTANYPHVIRGVVGIVVAYIVGDWVTEELL